MNNNYNSNLYLTTSDLNDLEDIIESLTNEIQEKIFNNTTSPLRNIEIGDDLSFKTLYLSFPTNSSENINNTSFKIIVNTNNNYVIHYRLNPDNGFHNITIFDNINSYILYGKHDSNNKSLYSNIIRFKLPRDFGTVTDIDDTDIFYQYIKIYDDEKIIPNYEKHVWQDNEILSMQKIDNIEKGIKNIGYYYYKPNGWLTNREWLPITSTEYYNTHTNIQNISYQDLNRWLTDLSLISFDNLDKMTIWNSNVSEIDWNKQNDTDWEEL